MTSTSIPILIAGLLVASTTFAADGAGESPTAKQLIDGSAASGALVTEIERRLEALVPELSTRDLAAMAQSAEEAGDEAAMRRAQSTLKKLHLNYAGRLLDPPAGADALRKSFETLPQFYEAYEEQPRRETPDAIFAMLQKLNPAQVELPVIVPDDQLYNDGAKNTPVGRKFRHSFTLPGKPVKGWLQVYLQGGSFSVNGHDYGWFTGSSSDLRRDITADLHIGENLIEISDAWYDRFMVVRGGALLESGVTVPILSGRGTWEIYSEGQKSVADGPNEKVNPKDTNDQPKPQANSTWGPVTIGCYEKGFYRRQPLRWLAMNQILTLRTQGGVTPWQRPSANGSIAALFACPHFGQTDVASFAARFDMQVDALWFGSRDQGVEPTAWSAYRDRRYDLMVVGNTRPADFLKSLAG